MPRERAEVVPDRAGDALRRLVDLASHRSGAVFTLMNHACVTLPQVLLMSRVEQMGSASLSDLADGSTTSAAALSQMIERLVQQGWLDRAEDLIDRRRKAIRATSRARVLLRRLESARSADYKLGLASLGDDLRTQLAKLLERVADEIEAARAGDRLPGASKEKEFGR